MKKRILSIALVVAMVALAAVGSLAYFTDTDAVHNEITVGSVDLKIVEKFDEDNTILTPVDTATFTSVTVENARTGNKVVDVKNDGEVPAYVRLLIAVEDTKDVGAATYINTYYGANGTTQIQSSNTTSVVDKITSYYGGKGSNDWLQIESADGTVYTVYSITLSDALAAGQSTESNTWPLLRGIYIMAAADNAWADIVGDEYDVLVLAQGSQVINANKDANWNIDTAFGWSMAYNADAAVANLFTNAGLGNFSAHTYKSELGVGESMWG